MQRGYVLEANFVVIWFLCPPFIVMLAVWLEMTNFWNKILLGNTLYSKFSTHNLTSFLRLGNVYVTYCS
jgi:hypothetical protein